MMISRVSAAGPTLRIEPQSFAPLPPAPHWMDTGSTAGFGTGRTSSTLGAPELGEFGHGDTSQTGAGREAGACYQPWPGSKAGPGSGASSRRTVPSMRP
jgi:hypothetical protein